nr:basic proline-rich protein-like [Manis javanica]
MPHPQAPFIAGRSAWFRFGSVHGDRPCPRGAGGAPGPDHLAALIPRQADFAPASVQEKLTGSLQLDPLHPPGSSNPLPKALRRKGWAGVTGSGVPGSRGWRPVPEAGRATTAPPSPLLATASLTPWAPAGGVAATGPPRAGARASPAPVLRERPGSGSWVHAVGRPRRDARAGRTRLAAEIASPPAWGSWRGRVPAHIRGRVKAAPPRAAEASLPRAPERSGPADHRQPLGPGPPPPGTRLAVLPDLARRPLTRPAAPRVRLSAPQDPACRPRTATGVSSWPEGENSLAHTLTAAS